MIVGSTYVNETTGIPIDFYEIKVKSFTKQLYPGKNTNLVGYNGMFPGPTFKIQRGRETLVRFVNEYNRPSSVHLHGSPTRAPWDGWAEHIFTPGQYHVRQPTSPSQKLLNLLTSLFEGLLLPQQPSRPYPVVSRPRRPHHRAKLVLRTGGFLPTRRCRERRAATASHWKIRHPSHAHSRRVPKQLPAQKPAGGG